MKHFLLVFSLLFSCHLVFASTTSYDCQTSTINSNLNYFSGNTGPLSDTLSKNEFTKIKLTAISLAITLGVFGVHRLYLGTKPNVPIVYTLTLGGGFFVLPIIDIVYIILAKDIQQIRNNDYVFMWNKKKKTKDL